MIKQTELEQIPIIVLCIRDIRDYMDDSRRAEQQEKYRRKFQDYIIRVNGSNDDINYVLRLRNVGRGTAFNTEVEIEDAQLEIKKHETQFFAPLGDEHSIRVSGLNALADLNGKIFIVHCEDAANTRYFFQYKIIDVESKKVTFLDKGKEVMNLKNK